MGRGIIKEVAGMKAAVDVAGRKDQRGEEQRSDRELGNGYG